MYLWYLFDTTSNENVTTNIKLIKRIHEVSGI